MEQEICFDFSLQFLYEKFLILRKTERGVMKNF